ETAQVALLIEDSRGRMIRTRRSVVNAYVLGSGHMRLAASLVILLAASPAVASPLEDPSLGGAVFTGVTHPHATAIHLNPAALGLAGMGAHFYLGGSLRLDRIRIERRIVDAAGATRDGPTVSDTPLTPGAM